MSRDQFAKNGKLLTNWWTLVAGFKKEVELAMTIYCTSIENYEGKHHIKCPNLILNYLKLQF